MMVALAALVVMASIVGAQATVGATSLDTPFDYVDKFGVIGLLLLAMALFLRGDIVPGKTYKAQIKGLIKDRDEWKQRALRGTRLAEHAVDVVERDGQ